MTAASTLGSVGTAIPAAIASAASPTPSARSDRGRHDTTTRTTTATDARSRGSGRGSRCDRAQPLAADETAEGAHHRPVEPEPTPAPVVAGSHPRLGGEDGAVVPEVAGDREVAGQRCEGAGRRRRARAQRARHDDAEDQLVFTAMEHREAGRGHPLEHRHVVPDLGALERPDRHQHSEQRHLTPGDVLDSAHNRRGRGDEVTLVALVEVPCGDEAVEVHTGIVVRSPVSGGAVSARAGRRARSEQAGTRRSRPRPGSRRSPARGSRGSCATSARASALRRR